MDLLREYVRLVLEKEQDDELEAEPSVEPQEPPQELEPEQPPPRKRKSKFPPEAPQDAPYEEYLFGDQRKQVDEPNTEEEQKLVRMIRSHYKGGEWIVRGMEGNIIDELLSLRDQGYYKQWLEVPQQYTKAYRLLDDIEYDDFEMMAGLDDEDHYDIGYGGRKEDPHYKTELVVDRGGTYHPKGGGTSSWTVSKQAIIQMAEDEFFRISPQYPTDESHIVIAVADLNAVRDKFLFNPDAMNRIGLPGKFRYQKEIVGVGTIPLELMVISQVPNKDWQWDREAVEEWEEGAWNRTEEDEIEMEEAGERPDITYSYETVDEYDEYHADEYQAHRQLLVARMVEYLP